jgi:hypothetical protein
MKQPSAARQAAGRKTGLANLRHGLTLTPEHRVWRNIRQRCENPNDDHYSRYGAVGIRVCERWQVFENFIADMGPRPSAKHTIDRKNGKGHYEPGNCRWATAIEQNNNLISNVRIEHAGESLTIPQWARRVGLHESTLRNRVATGWKFEDALARAAKRGLRRPR